MMAAAEWWPWPGDYQVDLRVQPIQLRSVSASVNRPCACSRDADFGRAATMTIDLPTAT